jgi:hypothetical protein
MAYWYINYGDGSTTGYYAVTRWAATTAKVVGNIVRQLAVPTIGNERCFICVVAGTTTGAEPTWVLTPGAKTFDGAITWMECSGRVGTNGGAGTGAVNLVPQWTTALGTVTLGMQIRGNSNHVSSLLICTTAGAVGATEPTWAGSNGQTTIDGTAVWTRIGFTSDFTPFQSPIARLATALATYHAAGDIQFVADNHAESQVTGITLNFINPPSRTYCIDHTVGAPGPGDLRTTASITCTAASGASILAGGTGYVYGLSYICTQLSGSAQNIQNFAGIMDYEACVFSALTNVTVGAQQQINGFCNLNNCTMRWPIGTTTPRLRVNQATFTWRNSVALAADSQPPLYLFSTVTGSCNIYCEGVDFSGLGASCAGIIEGVPSGSRIMLNGCKYPPGVPVIATQSPGGWYVDTIQTDTGGIFSRSERYRYNSSQLTELTVVRTNGATDGVTPISWKIFAGNNQWGRPFQSMPIAIWNARVGTPITVTIEMLADGVILSNAQIYIEAVYYGSASSTLASFINSGVASAMEVGFLYPVSSASWITTGLTVPIPQNMSVTFTPQAIGFVVVYVMIPGNSAITGNIYIDPKVVIS